MFLSRINIFLNDAIILDLEMFYKVIPNRHPPEKV